MFGLGKKKPAPAPQATTTVNPPRWRIVKDPHAAKFDVERYDVRMGDYGGMVAGYVIAHTSKTEQAARNWLEREIKRPIILASFDATGEQKPNITGEK